MAIGRKQSESASKDGGKGEETRQAARSLLEDVETERSLFLEAPALMAAEEGEERAYGRTKYRKEEKEEGGVSFTLVLNCTTAAAADGSEGKTAAGRDQEREEAKLTLERGMPLRVCDLKHCIEAAHSIPACCQTLHLNGFPLQDDLSPLEAYRLRDGDTLHVNYSSKGDVAEVLEAVDHMTLSRRLVEASLRQEEEEEEEVDETVEARNRHHTKINSLPEVYFAQWGSQRATANRRLFVVCGGLDAMQRLHASLLQLKWAQMPLLFQWLEHAVLRTYWNLTADFSVRMYVLQYPKALSCIMRSFLRVELYETSKPVQQAAPVKDSHAAAREMERRGRGEGRAPAPCVLTVTDRMACEVVFKAMGALCK